MMADKKWSMENSNLDENIGKISCKRYLLTRNRHMINDSAPPDLRLMFWNQEFVMGPMCLEPSTSNNYIVREAKTYNSQDVNMD